MTQRERHASAGLSATAPAPLATGASAGPPAPPRPAPAPDARPGSLWEDVLHSPAPAAVDRVLALVAGREAVCPLRCLGKGDRPEDLSEAGRAATFPERVRGLREHALGQAVRAREQAERRCQRLRQEEAAWPRLE